MLFSFSFSWILLCFTFCILFGIYFTYYKPKINTFNELKNNPDFVNAMLIFESNSEFDKTSYFKIQKHIKIFMIYYSEINSINTVLKLKEQKDTIVKYANKMKVSIPSIMRRYTFQQTAIQAIQCILENYITMKDNDR